jgi:hypothetical protein
MVDKILEVIRELAVQEAAVQSGRLPFVKFGVVSISDANYRRRALFGLEVYRVPPPSHCLPSAFASETASSSDSPRRGTTASTAFRTTHSAFLSVRSGSQAQRLELGQQPALFVYLSLLIYIFLKLTIGFIYLLCIPEPSDGGSFIL